MQIEALRDKVYFLAGQLAQAKEVYAEAVKEVEDANKKQAKPEELTTSQPSN